MELWTIDERGFECLGGGHSTKGSQKVRTLLNKKWVLALPHPPPSLTYAVNKKRKLPETISPQNKKERFVLSVPEFFLVRHRTFCSCQVLYCPLGLCPLHAKSLQVMAGGRRSDQTLRRPRKKARYLDYQHAGFSFLSF